MFEIANVRNSGKFKILAFHKALGKPNTVFTSILTLATGEKKYIDIFTVIGILFSVKISQNARLFSSWVMQCNDSNLSKSSRISFPIS